jgi:hypothetical protein
MYMADADRKSDQRTVDDIAPRQCAAVEINVALESALNNDICQSFYFPTLDGKRRIA